jgi:hypothetical protein
LWCLSPASAYVPYNLIFPELRVSGLSLHNMLILTTNPVKHRMTCYICACKFQFSVGGSQNLMVAHSELFLSFTSTRCPSIRYTGLTQLIRHHTAFPCPVPRQPLLGNRKIPPTTPPLSCHNCRRKTPANPSPRVPLPGQGCICNGPRADTTDVGQGDQAD